MLTMDSSPPLPLSHEPSSASQPIGLDELLCFSLYSAGLAFNRVYKPLLDELGLTYPQYLVMVTLWAEDNQTVGGLGRQLFLESNTLTPLLKRLEAGGYISRSRDDADERVVRIGLTGAGLALQDKAKHIPGCIFAATGFSPAKLKQLHADISTLRENLLDPLSFNAHNFKL